jgi:DNA polymerase-3 subunit gamma/tau
VLSRAQVHEFRTIAAKTVADRLRFIAAEEQIEVPDEALLLLARAGEGSMRDSLSAFDQVRAFAGDHITTEDVVTVLGLVGRDLVFDMLEAVVTEDAAAAFALTERAIERGYDLRLLCRELSRAMRDLLILSVDKSRASDPDVVGDSDRDRLLQLVNRWSREDLLRGFDLMTRVEQEIRTSDQPRFNMEMALLRLMHLRKLVPLTDLLSGAAGATGAIGATRVSGGTGATGATRAPGAGRAPATTPAARPSNSAVRPAPASGAPSASAVATATSPPRTGAGPAPGTSYRDALLAEIKAAKPIFYNLVVAQAFSIDADEGGVTFTFQPNQKVPKLQCEENRALVQSLIEKVTGEKRAVRIEFTDAASSTPALVPSSSGAAPTSQERTDAAMQNPTVQHLLEVFPVEKTTVRDE